MMQSPHLQRSTENVNKLPELSRFGKPSSSVQGTGLICDANQNFGPNFNPARTGHAYLVTFLVWSSWTLRKLAFPRNSLVIQQEKAGKESIKILNLEMSFAAAPLNRTALHYACVYDQPKVVTLLIKMNSDVNICDDDKSTALIKAVQFQAEECAMILLQSDADPNVMDASGNTALHYAVYSKNTCTAANLLRHKAMIEAKNKDSLTPLLLALKENNQQMTEFLVDMGASIHTMDHHGRTSLMLAAGHKSKGTVRLLLQKGVDVCLKDHSGRTALSYAVNCSDNLKEIAVAYEEKQREMFQNKYPEVLAGKTSEEEQARLDVCEVNELKDKQHCRGPEIEKIETPAMCEGGGAASASSHDELPKPNKQQLALEKEHHDQAKIEMDNERDIVEEILRNQIFYEKELDDLNEQLQYSCSQHAYLNMENEFLRQEVLSLEELKILYGKLEEEKKELEEKIVTFQSRENDSVEIDPRGQYEAASERTEREKTLEETVQSLQAKIYLHQLREHHDVSMRSQMRLNIQDMKARLFDMNNQVYAYKIELEQCKQLYLEELDRTMSLSDELSMTKERLAEVSNELGRHRNVQETSMILLHTSRVEITACRTVAASSISLSSEQYFQEETS
ncbi:ankyrin repeat domain-containing protein 26-like isoform X2 [Sciurus carolinensis]|uniref:ankyrin repeat domain-containing protein 26-like isoform X2 n=1 Tax=Sciurus carolinensis TaxID=30640 RepID=UPI001FB45242|nr:ankyrin repeat domain-containing protein 26-like isoform X2 [Sciurus carolinensis]